MVIFDGSGGGPPEAQGLSMLGNAGAEGFGTRNAGATGATWVDGGGGFGGLHPGFASGPRGAVCVAADATDPTGGGGCAVPQDPATSAM
jgi:hypothetical protein